MSRKETQPRDTFDTASSGQPTIMSFFRTRFVTFIETNVLTKSRLRFLPNFDRPNYGPNADADLSRAKSWNLFGKTTMERRVKRRRLDPKAVSDSEEELVERYSLAESAS
jgi:hypothetical protein